MKAPLATALIALLALAVYLCPGAANWCVLDRSAFLRGEWWRAFTGHLVHFSNSHLWLDVAVFLAAGALVELKSRRVLMTLLAVASMAISAAVLILAPEYQFYGGLSGVATALLFLVALQGVEENGIRRVYGILVITAILGKLAFEVLYPQPLFVQFDSAAIRSAPISHVAGIVAALGLWCVSVLRVRTKWFSHTLAFSRERVAAREIKNQSADAARCPSRISARPQAARPNRRNRLA